MALYQAEDKTRIQREKAKQAISLALEGRWQEAVEINRAILEVFPNDVESYNRLGKALLELGRYPEAKKAFSKAKEIAPYNTIAKRNLQRLSRLPNKASAPKESAGKVSPRLFIAETGKTGIANLVDAAPHEVLAKVVAGDRVELRVEGKKVAVVTLNGDSLGQLEPKLALRLIGLVEGGNRYDAAVASIHDSAIKVIIKETYCHPSRAGRISFPTKGTNDFRPYVRGELLHRQAEDEEDPSSDELQDWEGQEEPTPEEIPFYRDRSHSNDGAEEEEPQEEEET